MALLDIFSTPTILLIAIVLLLISGIYLYISYKITEQDHKLNSMLGLITTLAEELQFIRSKINYGNVNNIPQIIDPLIPVSDDEDEDEDEEEEDDDEETDGEELIDGEYEDDDVDEENDDQILNGEIVNDVLYTEDLDELRKDKLKHIPMPEYKLDVNDNILNIDIQNLDNFKDTLEDIKTIHLEGPIDIDNEDGILQEFVSSYTNNENDLVGDNQINIMKNDYKRMSITKLREILIGRGIKQDPYKLKKNELIKLLEEE